MLLLHMIKRVEKPQQKKLNQFIKKLLKMTVNQILIKEFLFNIKKWNVNITLIFIFLIYLSKKKINSICIINKWFD